MFCRFIAILTVTLILTLSATTVAAQDSGDDLEKLRASAELGFAAAQYNLGEHYYLSNLKVRGPREPDYTKAVEWYRRAAEQGYWGAQLKLSHILSEGGGGVPEDRVLAYMWYTLALPFCQNDDPKSIMGFFKCLEPRSEFPIRGMRDALAKHMTPAEIAEAKRLASERPERLPLKRR